MARILYSCCGEGQGHSSRVFTITQALTRLGHEVKILASNKAYQVLQPRLPAVLEIPGFTFVYRNNRVELGASAWGNLPLLRRRGGIIRELTRLIEGWQPHLAITDFEPFLPRAAHRAGLRCIGLDHQGVIPYARPPLPLGQRIPAFAARLVTQQTGYREAARLATSFFYPPLPPGGNVQFFPPILREKVRALTPRDDGFVVVYQTSSSFTRLPELLKTLPFEFKVFAYEREGRDGNLSYYPRSDVRFIEEVGNASWVLTNGGYTLMSEALYLGKPVFSLPVAWQFEQWLNARYLHDLGYGVMCDDLRDFPAKITEFCSQLDRFRENLSRQSFVGNELVLARILEFLPGGRAAQLPAGTEIGAAAGGERLRF